MIQDPYSREHHRIKRSLQPPSSASPAAASHLRVCWLWLSNSAAGFPFLPVSAAAGSRSPVPTVAVGWLPISAAPSAPLAPCPAVPAALLPLASFLLASAAASSRPSRFHSYRLRVCPRRQPVRHRHTANQHPHPHPMHHKRAHQRSRDVALHPPSTRVLAGCRSLLLLAPFLPASAAAGSQPSPQSNRQSNRQ